LSEILASPWVTPRVASQILGASELMVYKYALLGRIRPKIEAGINVRFSREDVEALARDHDRVAARIRARSAARR
jgi:predicted site-specific integrase-resolvase